MRRWTAILAAMMAAVAIAACGDSPEDEARDDGEDVGAAVRALFDSGSVAEAGTALTDLKESVANVEDDTKDEVQEQVDVQTQTLTDAIDSARTASDPQAAVNTLKQAAQQIRSQADSFRNGDDSVGNEFWRGFEDGYDD